MSVTSKKPHFEAPTIENDLGRLTADQIHAQQQFVNRANAAYNYVKRYGLPAGYTESFEVYQDFVRQNDNTLPINIEDLYALDMAISQTIWDNDIFSQLGIPTTVMARPRFELKDYLVQSEEWPRFTRNFNQPVFMRLKESSQFTNGIGLHLGISIGWQEIQESAGGLWDPQSILMQELAAKFGLMKSRRGFLGTSCLDAQGDDGSDASSFGITGVFNYANAQTFEAGAGADDDITSQGDMEVTVRAALTKLKKVYQAGSYVIVSSSGVASEMFLHRDTYQQRLDSERVKEIMSIITKYARNGSWGGWYVTDQLVAAAETTSNGAMMIMKVAPSLITRKLIYPQQSLPMMNKTYANDIQENHIFADLIQVKKVDTTNNAIPIAIASSITTSTTGFIPNGTRIL